MATKFYVDRGELLRVIRLRLPSVVLLQRVHELGDLFEECNHLVVPFVGFQFDEDLDMITQVFSVELSKRPDVLHVDRVDQTLDLVRKWRMVFV